MEPARALRRLKAVFGLGGGSACPAAGGYAATSGPFAVGSEFDELDEIDSLDPARGLLCAVTEWEKREIASVNRCWATVSVGPTISSNETRSFGMRASVRSEHVETNE